MYNIEKGNFIMSKTCKIILFLITLVGIIGCVFVLLERKKQTETPLFQEEDTEPPVTFEQKVSSLKKAGRTYIGLV